MSTAPQWQRSDRPKVTRRLREASQNEHRATARAIWQAQSEKRVARAISQKPFCVAIYRENGRGHLRGQRFVRACAIEMHMDISQEPFCVEIYRENAKRFRYHLDGIPGINTYRKNPSVWTPKTIAHHSTIPWRGRLPPSSSDERLLRRSSKVLVAWASFETIWMGKKMI